MARSEIDEKAQDLEGNALDGLLLHIYEHGTTNHVDLYTTELGMVAAANPIVSVYGTFSGAWIEDGQYDYHFEDPQTPERIDPVTRVRGVFSGRDLREELLEPAMRVSDLVIPIGIPLPWPGAALPSVRFDWADGGLISKTTYADYFSLVGHIYNNGVDPGGNMFRKADRRGRVGIGADDMGTLQGAAGRLTVAAGHPNVRGQVGGTERHTLLAAESGMNGSAVSNGDGGHAHPGQLEPGVVVPGNNWPGPAFGSGSTYWGFMQPNTGQHAHSMSARNADNPHENMPGYQVENYIVRVI